MSWAPPRIQDFVDRARREVVAHDDGVARLKADFEATFSDRSAVAALINGFLEQMVDRAAFSGDGFSGGDLLNIVYGEQLCIRLVKDRSDLTGFSLDVSTDTLNNYPSDTLLMPLCGPELEFDWYELDEGGDFDVFDGSLRIRHAGGERLCVGQALNVDARRRFPALPPSPSTVYAILSGPVRNAQIVSFNPGTLQALGASMSSDSNSILCTLLDLFRTEDCVGDADLLARYAEHHDHHVRWAAVRAMGRCNRARALAQVVTMAKLDAHPFIRRAAALTVSNAEQAHA